jgi:F0F1-type ATP synthase membrane subunit b/b'
MTDLFVVLEKYTPLLTGLLGGIGVKVLDKVMSKRSEAFNESTKIREELRQQVNALREEAEASKGEADEWRQKYWEQVELNISQRGLLEDLRVEVDKLHKIASKSTGHLGAVE